MPIYSPEGQVYLDRVHSNGREADSEFDAEEHLFRRYPKNFLRAGKPIPLSMTFEEDSGISVNRSKYSRPEDVLEPLEPDCCDGHRVRNCVVLDFLVADVPREIAVNDNSGRTFIFRLAHKPVTHCYAHSEIWCNQRGDTEQPYEHLRSPLRTFSAVN